MSQNIYVDYSYEQFMNYPRRIIMIAETGVFSARKDPVCFFGISGWPCTLLRRGIVFLGIGAAALLWGSDVWYHVFIAHESGFWRHMLDFTSHEAFMRLVATVPILLLGVVGNLAVRVEEKRMEAVSSALSELQQIFDGAGEVMVVIDTSSTVRRVNQKACDLFGIQPGETVGRFCYEVFPSAFCHSPSCPLRRVLSGQEYLASELEKERQDGSRVACMVTVSAFRATDGQLLGIIESFADITRRKEMEEELRRHRDELEAMVRERTAELARANEAYRQEIAERRRIQAQLEQANRDLKEHQAQLIQSEKMASIGQLAAGVAHEINNPTGFIRSNLNALAGYQTELKELVTRCSTLKDVVARRVQETGDAELDEALQAVSSFADDIDLDFILEDMAEAVAQCIEGADRIKEIVSDLKEFSHVDQAEFKEADLNKGLKSTINIAWNEIKYRAEVETDFGDIPPVRCYPQQINQVFLNLLVNAAQAMEDKGTIRVSTRYVEEDGVPQVIVEISDTGKGIPPEVLPRIFDPFFTTKEVGDGTGLGLNIAYKIVKKHGGRIDVKSEVGKGTTFTIRLPIAGPSEQEAE